MAAADPARRIRPDERVLADPVPGMARERAVATDGMWAGLVRTEAQTASGWHHHGDYDTCAYVVSGQLRMESGPGGADVVVAEPGDFLFVPKGAIHREGNPTDGDGEVVVVRVGTGQVVFEVDGPA
ncbi:MAG: cupin domain-containing protein [Acidimicrobiales bacterium]